MTDFIPRNSSYAEDVRDSFGRQGLMTNLGARLSSVQPGICEIELPFSDKVSQQHGFFHGGAIGAIADSAGGYAGLSLMNSGFVVLTVEYKINLIAPGQGELAIARGRVVKPGRTLTITQIEVSVLDGHRETQIAVAQQTLMGMAAKPGMEAG